MKNRYVFALFIVFLIVSLTPASAVNIAGINNNVVNNNPATENIQIEIDQLQPQIQDLNSDVGSLKIKADKLKNIWYNPLYWGEASTLLMEMSLIAYKMQTSSSKLQETSEKVRIDAEKLEAESQKELKANKENISASEENAGLMSKELEKRFKIGFVPTPTSNGFMVGDVVQYKSQNKYYRYLTIVRNEKTENFVVLEGAAGKNITVNKEQLSGLVNLKLVPQKPVNGTKVVFEANKIQLDMIKAMIKQAESKEAKANDYSIYGSILEGSSLTVFFIAGVIGAIALVLAPTGIGSIPAAVLGLVAIGLTLTAIGLAAGGVSFDKVAENNLNMASEIRKEAAADLEDLNRYMAASSHVPVANNMSLNTTMDLSINTTLNTTDPDGDKLKACIVTQPKHGNLKINEAFDLNTEFVYTPANNYSGNDSFTYKVVDSNGLISNVATVNITVIKNHLPVANNMTLYSQKDAPLSATFNATDIDGDKLTAITINQPKFAQVTLDKGLGFTYKLNKWISQTSESFSYQVIDSKGGLSNIAWVKVVFVT